MTELANNPQGDGQVAPDAETELADAQVQGDENAEIDPETGEPVAPIDDTEEIEREGKKYRIPKALKGEFLMQADYTRKTQEVSERGKALETRQAEFNQQTQAHQELIKDVGNLQTLSSLVELYEKTDWQALRAQDANAAQDRWFEYQQILTAQRKASDELRGKMEKRNLDAQQATAKREEETKAILSRDISWTPELHGKMTDFAARDFGFTPAELRTATTDPRVAKLLHRAYLGDQAIRRAAAAARLKAQEGVQPAPKVGGKASNTATLRPDSPSGDRLSGDEWLRRRNEQLRKA